MEENLSQDIIQSAPSPPVEEIISPPVTQPPFGSWWKVGGLVMATLLLAGGIFFAGYQYSQRQILPSIAYPTNTPTPSFTPTLTPTPTVSLRPISTPTPTKTLSNKRFTLKCKWCSSGFSFELSSTTTILPEATTISEDPGGAAPYWNILTPAGRQIIFYRGAAIGDLYAWFDGRSTNQPYDREAWKNPPNVEYFSINNVNKSTIDSQKVIEFNGCWNEPEDMCSHRKYFIFQSGGKLWQTGEETPTIYRKIVETIRF